MGTAATASPNLNFSYSPPKPSRSIEAEVSGAWSPDSTGLSSCSEDETAGPSPSPRSESTDSSSSSENGNVAESRAGISGSIKLTKELSNARVYTRCVNAHHTRNVLISGVQFKVPEHRGEFYNWVRRQTLEAWLHDREGTATERHIAVLYGTLDIEE